MNRTLDRRTVLAAVGGVATTALTGCGAPADGGDGGAEEPTPGGNGATETVEMTDQLIYDPDSLTVSTGTTVVWENVGQVGHSVTAYEDEIPADAEYFASGDFDSEQAARNEYTVGGPGDVEGGETYEHTFEVAGDYRYFCIPHEAQGMIASLTVESE